MAVAMVMKVDVHMNALLALRLSRRQYFNVLNTRPA
jgi:hypothetical protein